MNDHNNHPLQIQAPDTTGLTTNIGLRMSENYLIMEDFMEFIDRIVTNQKILKILPGAAL